MSRKSKEELQDHHKIKSLPLDKSFCSEKADELEAILQELNDLLSVAGIEIRAAESTLTIDVNGEKFASVTKRRAGRKKKNAAQQYEEILAYRETHTAQETFEWLGLTKQTYYRRIKELKKEAEQESQI
ncbi:MAG: hypothetical protein IKD59_09910 [Lachnospiraceae bacterium]|nr:hypothetical protein [Lachnospiraceae bacterium]MBR2842631.1 hypothetical protein [Lachnospiraceae bacterium]MBR3196286.1 hypothetical protein [Clostridia bacterium]